jgi:hypothetical protein
MERITALTECVYLIGGEASPLVKIGRSIDVRARLATLQSMSPVKLAVLWQTIGGAELELALHRHFDARRCHGEWFEFPDHDAPEQVVRALPEIAAEAQRSYRRNPGGGKRSPALWLAPVRGYRQPIMDLASGPRGATNMAAREALGVSPATAHRYLVALCADGVIEMRGAGRAARWHTVTDNPRDNINDDAG